MIVSRELHVRSKKVHCPIDTFKTKQLPLSKCNEFKLEPNAKSMWENLSLLHKIPHTMDSYEN